MKQRIFPLLLALALLTGCAGAPAADGVASSAGSSSPAESSASAESQSEVATTSEMAPVEDVVTADMEPIEGSALLDGSYPIAVDSSSSMFRVTDCTLTVESGQMSAVMTMSGTGYLYIYPGTGEEAASAEESAYIPYQEDANGAHTYTIPVEALDAGIDCAAFSKKKEKWYDRTLVFRSDSLPAEAFAERRTVTVQDLALEDGAYTVEVTLEGGSGKANVASPTELTVRDGAATARLIWSSSNYDYMKVDGAQYDVLEMENGSVFEIPVSGFDGPISVLADTTAMSTPHEIAYTLRFDSATIQPAEAE